MIYLINIKKFLVVLLALVWITPSCVKSQQCECKKTGNDTARVFYINGNLDDSQKACNGMAETGESCTLKTN